MLDAIDRSTASGERDFALLALIFNTGARVQEVLDLRLQDVRLDPPQQVRLKGKGNKVRVCPIWPRAAQLLGELVRRRSNDHPDLALEPLFVNQRGEPLSRFGVRYVSRKHAIQSGVTTAAAQTLPNPYALKHTTGVHLLKAGVDFATISQWLGRASLNTTMRYARSDHDLKRQALSQVFPDILAPNAKTHVLFDPGGLRHWLRRLSVMWRDHEVGVLATQGRGCATPHKRTVHRSAGERAAQWPARARCRGPATAHPPAGQPWSLHEPEPRAVGTGRRDVQAQGLNGSYTTPPQCWMVWCIRNFDTRSLASMARAIPAAASAEATSRRPSPS